MKVNHKSAVSKLTRNELLELNGGILISTQIISSEELPIIPFGDPRDWDPFFKNLVQVEY